MRVTEEIKSRLDIVDVVSETVSLRKSGRNLSGFCPFHQNTRTPSFFVFPETQTWRCFGACAEGGDIFSYVMKANTWDFREALENLAGRAGVTLEDRKPVDKKKVAHEEKLADLTAAAADYFHQLFLHAPQAEFARNYVAGREYNQETIETFQFGFALNAWDACRSHFNGQGYTDDELLEVGLLTENPDKGTKYDRFRNRLMIPIRNVDGRIVGFGARTLEKDGIPKYLNSPQTPLFDKSRILFGLDMAKRNIREARQAVIVEGYMDVIRAWQGGYGNVVAQMGTALTETQLQQLKRYTKRFILALDADAAGAQATLRSLQVARETLDREVEAKFDARGLVQHEGRLKADIRVVGMPEGKDPDDIIREDADEWATLVEQAKPVVAYVIDVTTANLDMEDAKGKTAVAQQVIPLIKDINDPVERDHYWQQLARSLQIDERALRQTQVEERRPRQRYQPPPPPEMPPNDDSVEWQQMPKTAVASARNPINANMRQANYLHQCMNDLRIIPMVNERLGACEEAPVGDEDFDLAEDRAIMKKLMQWQANKSVAVTPDLWDNLEKTLLDRMQYLQTLPSSSETEPERLADTLVSSVLDWRLVKVQQLYNKIDENQALNDQSTVEILRDLLSAMNRLNKARNAMSATGRRRTQDAERYGR